MTPERWQRIDQLFHAVLERDPAERTTFLDQACDGDEELRRKVAALLTADAKADSVKQELAAQVAAEMLGGGQTRQIIGKQIGHYKILSQIGVGGMGEVYLAQDTRLRRKVALKLLPAQFIQDAERVRRFEREARAASALNHPNILTIHEIGESEELHFIATEFVEGQTLRQRLKDGRMTMQEAFEVAMQVAGALNAAHTAGIIHRDIKPENIMVRPDGLVKVLDFGLAKLTERSAAAVDSQAPAVAISTTEPGMVMGTARYMSPEQARGLEVDARTDIFSLGVMLYEMLAGRRPFEGATMSDVVAAVLTQEPEPLRHHNKEVALRLEQVVLKCLAKDPGQRFQTAGDLAGALKIATQRRVATGNEWRSFFKSRLVWLVSAIAVLFIGAAAYWKLQSKAAPNPQIKSLAVLPLENLSGDPAQEYFADGMTEALINNLSQVRALRVISRTSVMRFKRSQKSLREIAQELNVDAVIEGSVQREDGRVKITARLIHAVNETPLRSFDYEREMADVLKLQSEVARAVADEIRIQVTAEERARLTAARSVKPEAHLEYLLGRYHGQRFNEENLKLSIGHFERAIQLDTGYAAAWAGLSAAWANRGEWGARSFREVESPARNAALKAIELDSGIAEAHVSLARIKYVYDWDWASAEASYRRAIDLDPDNAAAHRSFANMLMALGRHSEAISEIQTAEQLDPLSSINQSDFGRVLYRARNYEEAERHLTRAIELDPRNHGAYSRLGDLYDRMGRYADAIANLEKRKALLRGTGNDRFLIASFARVYARMGRRGEALQLLKDLQRTTEPASFPKMVAAAAWTALGDKDEAFRLLFSGVEEHSYLIHFIKVDPPLDDLHSDSRWKELLRRMNFPHE